jgi:2-oxoisovalerate dehydrogenase E1 component
MISTNVLQSAFIKMSQAVYLTHLYEENFKEVSKYVHATSRGHEAIQIAIGMSLEAQDFVSPYYRDDALLLGIGITPYHLMLQLLAKKDDIFSGGRLYYAHPSLKEHDKPKIIHQSSSTGMQAIPTTGIALGLMTKAKIGIASELEKKAIVICSMGDASVTEGEVSEALQMAALKQLPIIFLVQDNGWDISATAEETRAMNAFEYCKGFPSIEALSIDGSDFLECYTTVQRVFVKCREERRPFLIHAKVPLLNHHTSGVRKEWYRHDLEAHKVDDPYIKIRKLLLKSGISEQKMNDLFEEVKSSIDDQFLNAKNAPNPEPKDLYTHEFAPTNLGEEQGERAPSGGDEKVMVDCALFAIQQKMEEDDTVLLYGQDVGKRLGGVFREASTLADKFGEDRVFNTAIQEAFIIGSTAGMSAVGLKPIVEVQFADYIWPGLNQLYSEISRSCFLTQGKYPVNMTLRVPIGAYGSGGPYHSSSVESVLCNIKGIKVVYPSNGADLYGFMKTAIEDPNPVVIFEHKGLYWSKVKNTDFAKALLPSQDYRIPFGKAMMVKEVETKILNKENCILIVAYGMGVHWALNASLQFERNVGILDLRSLYPLDESLIFEKTKLYHRVIVVTEESVHSSFAQSVAARIQQNCFQYLDAPVLTVGSENLPAIPLNETLEIEMVFSSQKLISTIKQLIAY